MRTILAAIIAACMAVPATMAPPAAASLTITTDNGVRYSDWDGDRIEWRHRHHHRRHWRGERGRYHHWRRHHRRYDCYTRVSRHWRHHRLIIREVRICE